ncbi:hypothetical protein CIPAW_11G041100 [Carya illinoinensis]|uniref:Uncharacterized protein n=1 Tax=Carya illinoinensis TaxID=32201 RepID=A0A8T1P3F1_CARIL|nr:hypothetical protein CIPAW_11G041100 [Carya illinoinensis]KAG6686834.1 hypothetical protein I3842_11G040600 [Carya illinoinensis]
MALKVSTAIVFCFIAFLVLAHPIIASRQIETVLSETIAPSSVVIRSPSPEYPLSFIGSPSPGAGQPQFLEEYRGSPSPGGGILA